MRGEQASHITERKLAAEGEGDALHSLERLIDGDDYEDYVRSCEQARELPPKQLISFMDFLAGQYFLFSRRAAEDWDKKWAGKGFPENSVYSDCFGPIFNALGDAVAHIEDPAFKKQAEQGYLRILQRYVETEFLGQAGDKDWEFFLKQLSRKRAGLTGVYASGNPLAGAHAGDRFAEQFWEAEYAHTDESLLPIHRAIEQLGSFGGDQSAEFLIAFLQYYPEGAASAIADALSHINPERAIKQLLPLLKSKDEGVREAATRVLYRLEFGQIGISEDGVEYLKKIYDLGAYNRADYFAQRLTADGQIGIFDERRVLVKHFPLESLASDQARIKARVLDFTYETLFTPRPDETPKERAEREGELREFQENYFGFYNDDFFKKTGVRFNNLSFKEQGQLLLFYKYSTEKTRQRALQHVCSYGEDGFRAFLSLEYGRDLGEAVLAIGERFELAAAKRVFQKYSEIVEAAERVREYVAKTWGQDRAYTKETENRIVEGLLRRGKDLLIDFSSSAKESSAEDTRQIIAELARIKADILLFASTFTELSKEETIEFEDLQNTAFEMHLGPGLLRNPEKVAEMKRVYRENYKKYPADFRAALLAGFDRALENPHSRFYVFSYDNEIAAFCRFDELRGNDGEIEALYFGSFNADPRFAKSRIGSTFLKKILARESAAGVPIQADCDPQAPLTPTYLKLGFEKIAQHTLHGVPSIRIELSPAAARQKMRKAA